MFEFIQPQMVQYSTIAFNSHTNCTFFLCEFIVMVHSPTLHTVTILCIHSHNKIWLNDMNCA